jgi:multiple sugar transport system ATP-binding protein
VNTFVATFLGSPRMNLIEESRNGAPVKIGVRPEDVDVASSSSRGWDDARIIVVEPMGSETIVTLEYRGQRLVARVPGDSPLEPGRPAWVHLPPDRVLVFDEASGNRITEDTEGTV